MTSKRTIYGALPIVAAAYGEKFGVKVVIGNDAAYTDGNTIVVPNIPDDYPNMDAVWGYLTHEAAHVRFTDFTVSRRPGLHAALSNILEDCRIENEMIRQLPGTAHTLHEVARYMSQAGHYQHVTAQEAPASVLEGFCLYWLQTKAVGQSVLQPYLDTAAAVLGEVFPEGVVVRLNALLRKAVGATSTAEAVSLADEIIQMIKEEKEKEEQKQKSQAGQDPQGGGSDQDDGDDAPQGGSSDQDDGDDAPQGGSSDQDDGDDAPQRGVSVPGADGSPDATQQSAAEMLQQVLDAADSDLRADAREALKAELGCAAQDNEDDGYMTVRTALEGADRPIEGRVLKDEVKSLTSKLRTQLYGLVQASKRVAHNSQRSGKRVDSRRLHRVVAGDTRVFLRPREVNRPNTAVHILVDMSFSMYEPTANGKRREQIAREAALAIALALECIPGVNPAVTFFRNGGEDCLISAVRHGESVQKRAGRFLVEASGCTPMAEAIWHGAFELSKTRETRKMMVVVTDGEPNNPRACQAVINLCEQSGVEVFGIGVETTAVNRLFRKNIVIDDATALQSTLFRLMEQALTASAS